MSPPAGIFLSPAENRLRAGWRLLLHAVLVFAVSLPLSLAALLLLSAFTILAPRLEQSFDLRLQPPTALVDLLAQTPLSSQQLALTAAISFPCLTLATWLARRLIDRRSFRSLGFDPGGRPVGDMLIGFSLTGLLFGLLFAVEWALGWIRIEGWLWQVRGPGWAVALVIGSLLLFALVGFYEELVFRGYYLRNLTDGLGRTGAVLLSSTAFALAHAGNPFASLASTLGLLAAGLFLAYAALRTQRLWLAIGLHLGWNFFEGTIFGFPVSGTAAPGLLLQRDQGPPLFTGGEFGPEAGLVMLPTLLLGAGLIHLYSSRRKPQPGHPRRALHRDLS